MYYFYCTISILVRCPALPTMFRQKLIYLFIVLFSKVGQVSQLGRDVIVSFPNEKENIEDRIADVQAKYVASNI